MALNEGPFATYNDVTGVVNATAKSEISTLLDNFAALFGPADGASASSPEFCRIEKNSRELLDNEIVYLKAAIAAAPVV